MAVRPPADRMPYERGAGAPVPFDQPLTCIFLPSTSLHLPVPGQDAARHARLAAEIAGLVSAPPLETRVRGALRTLILGRKPTMEAAAAALGLHPRTLRRRLEEDGHVFDALRDEVRLATALEHLELTELPVGEIAASLSYASPEVFAEAFRRMRGLSPRAWRVRHTRGD
jgi:AraC-like DNA-binding protein